ncbi:MAG TPA: leucine--tRNA ligase [Lentisphaeria bacterium]|nr:MAG: leucine--tRNA ligase [Lentisphaerae bacterium GWF2_49_21]HBC86562.1 leucine--tRNA ligase [Lentisphaeria bacterium]
MTNKEYDFSKIEPKWQKYWDENKTFRADDFSGKKKFYCLVEFPYPSGDGLHVGHPRSYTALDILARKRRMQDCNVLFPMGFDSFGLPSENYAIKTGIHPTIVTRKNIERFTAQLKSLGFSFDWDRVFSTTDPDYYRWTQWIFIKFFEKGLAYKSKMPINWCLSCKIGLANEEVVDGKCERCGGDVEKRSIEQWMLKITAYADKLIKDLDTVDFLEKIKAQQINWIGRSEGADVDFMIDGTGRKITVYTTRPDTLFGATYMVLSPEHALVHEITSAQQKDAVDAYCRHAARMSDLERTEEKEKTGVFTGAYAVNPVNGKKIPVWIADYVLISYGTGAIMAVAAHDTRDFEFAVKFRLPVICIISPDVKEAESAGVDIQDVLEGKSCWSGNGRMINSSNSDGLDINGLEVTDSKRRTTEWLEKKGIGKGAVNYKLRDWVFSRQRYWGEPIPMIHCDKCGWVPVPEDQLPVLLPQVDKYEPTDTGESPLAVISDWVRTTCPKCGAAAKRETDTMPNWAGSSWYFLRYIDPKNNKCFADRKKLDYWMGVDWYNGGMEHTTLHLLYSRFWNKFLFDCGLVPTSEPYMKRTSHGMVLGEGGEKMSKSRGNVINPDDVVGKYGADVFRLYEMFIGPFDQSAAWDTKGISGIDRFLRKLWRMMVESEISDEPMNREQLRVLHQTIKKVGEDIETLDLNTAISQMMIFTNEFSKSGKLPREAAESFIKVLAPFAPHICEELWEIFGHGSSIAHAPWPAYKDEFLKLDEIEILVQIKGRPKARMMMPAGITQDKMQELALGNAEVGKELSGKKIIKVVCVPGRLVNIVSNP